MKIAGYQKTTLLDYPGNVASTIFTAGCNFRCGYCHNADIISASCDVIPEEDVLSHLKKRKGLLDAVCITGGEPTLQDGLLPFIEKIKKMGYAVKLDTNGTNPDIMMQLIRTGLIDYVAMDIKSNQEGYPAVCGIHSIPIEPIKESVTYLLAQKQVAYEFRTTLIKEYHTEQAILQIGGWIRGAEKYVLQSFLQSPSVRDRRLHGFSDTELEYVQKLLEPFSVNAKIRGYEE